MVASDRNESEGELGDVVRFVEVLSHALYPGGDEDSREPELSDVSCGRLDIDRVKWPRISRASRPGFAGLPLRRRF